MNLSVIVTEHCNLSCPRCMHGVPYLAIRKHYPISYFEWLSGILSEVRIGVLILEGGEPTLHPEFPELASRVRQWFNASSIVLTTNGARLKDVESTLHCFDEIQLTEYPGRNDAEVAWARSRDIPGLYAGFELPGGEQFPLDVTPCADATAAPMCRWKDCSIVWGESLYVCVGAERAGRRISLNDPGWRSKLNKVERTELCRSCFVPPSWRVVT
jgi:hypothetical protein